MSNLGLYQTMTTLSKKAGGPKQFLLIVFGCGYVIGRFTELGVKRTVKVIKEYRKNAGSSKTYYILSDTTSNEGLIFSVGDTFQILERDKDAVLIAKNEDNDNPYFVSAKLLQSISDYKK